MAGARFAGTAAGRGIHPPVSTVTRLSRRVASRSLSEVVGLGRRNGSVAVPARVASPARSAFPAEEIMFLAGKISFVAIVDTVESVVAELSGAGSDRIKVTTLSDIVEVETWARRRAREIPGNRMRRYADRSEATPRRAVKN